ncbi:MAG: 2OG-Fe(II) oxygenase, partial [Verrucomicrobiales bacterium]
MDRLVGLRARLALHFEEDLVKVQTPQFLAYSVGDFFVPHQDDNAEPDAPEFLRNRRVSAVILLNPGDYEGGLLTLLGH